MLAHFEEKAQLEGIDVNKIYKTSKSKKSKKKQSLPRTTAQPPLGGREEWKFSRTGRQILLAGQQRLEPSL